MPEVPKFSTLKLL